MNIPCHIVAVCGIVENDKNQILMVKHNHYGWVLPGGQVEEGEDLINALKREFLEETGIDIQIGDLFCVCSNIGKHTGYNGVKEIPTKIIFNFICKQIKYAQPLKTSGENNMTQFINKSEVTNLITNPAMKERFKKYLNYNGKLSYISYKNYPSFELFRDTLFNKLS